MTSFSPDYILKDPISKRSHILKYWGLGLQHRFFEGHNSTHHRVLGLRIWLYVLVPCLTELGELCGACCLPQNHLHLGQFLLDAAWGSLPSTLPLYQVPWIPAVTAGRGSFMTNASATSPRLKITQKPSEFILCCPYFLFSLKDLCFLFSCVCLCLQPLTLFEIKYKNKLNK